MCMPAKCEPLGIRSNIPIQVTNVAIGHTTVDSMCWCGVYWCTIHKNIHIAQPRPIAVDVFGRTPMLFKKPHAQKGAVQISLVQKKMIQTSTKKVGSSINTNYIDIFLHTRTFGRRATWFTQRIIESQVEWWWSTLSSTATAVAVYSGCGCCSLRVHCQMSNKLARWE